MGTLALYVAIVKSPSVRINTLNANRDGTGTISDLYIPGAAGGLCDEIHIKATVTTTAGMIRFYEHDGTNHRLLLEVPVTAITPSGTVQSFEAVLSALGWRIQTGRKITVSTEKGETFDVIMRSGGDF